MSYGLRLTQMIPQGEGYVSQKSFKRVMLMRHSYLFLLALTTLVFNQLFDNRLR